MGKIKDLNNRIKQLEEENEYLLQRIHDIEDKPLKKITADRIKWMDGTIDGLGMQNADLEIRINELTEMLSGNDTIRGHINDRVKDAEAHMIEHIWMLDGMETWLEEGKEINHDDWLRALHDVNKTIMCLHCMTLLLGDMKKVE